MKSLRQRVKAHSEYPPVLDCRGREIESVKLWKNGLSKAVDDKSRVALMTQDPLNFLRVVSALDGEVEAILLLSNTLPIKDAMELAEASNCTDVITDRSIDSGHALPIWTVEEVAGTNRSVKGLSTLWLMTTSGTTGQPKIVSHTLDSLSRSVFDFSSRGEQSLPVWGLLYEPTRFAGLQVVLQALIGGGQIALVDTSAPLAEQLSGLTVAKCNYLSATPTLWRRILMVPGHEQLALKQVTLGGEIADQATLDALKSAYPSARISHIYASTEAGVGFSVTDGIAGFPLEYLKRPPSDVQLKIEDGLLWLKPPKSVYRPISVSLEIDEDGYICSGDRVDMIDERVVFLGRENGLINVGGIKVLPETVESVINSVSGVKLSRVFGKGNPITGALVVAEVMVSPEADQKSVRFAVKEQCRLDLPREAVPAIIKFVDHIETNASGKLVRTNK